MRGCPHAVKLEGEGKISSASLKNEPGVSPLFLQNNHHCPNIRENMSQSTSTKIRKYTLPQRKRTTNAKIFNTIAWISCTSIFVYNSDSKVDLIADLRKFNYAIVCQFETV